MPQPANSAPSYPSYRHLAQLKLAHLKLILAMTGLSLSAITTVCVAETIEEPSQQAISQHPQVADCFRSVSAPRALLKDCAVALTIDSVTPQIRAQMQSMLAFQHARRLELSQARTLVNEAMARAPDDSLVKATQVAILIFESQFEAAIRAIDALLQESQQPSSAPILWFNRSLAMRGLGRYDQAQRDYQTFLQLSGHASDQSVTDPLLDAGPPQAR